jgi:hypothetical protein
LTRFRISPCQTASAIAAAGFHYAAATAFTCCLPPLMPLFAIFRHACRLFSMPFDIFDVGRHAMPIDAIAFFFHAAALPLRRHFLLPFTPMLSPFVLFRRQPPFASAAAPADAAAAVAATPCLPSPFRHHRRFASTLSRLHFTPFISFRRHAFAATISPPRHAAAATDIRLYRIFAAA